MKSLSIMLLLLVPFAAPAAGQDKAAAQEAELRAKKAELQAKESELRKQVELLKQESEMKRRQIEQERGMQMDQLREAAERQKQAMAEHLEQRLQKLEQAVAELFKMNEELAHRTRPEGPPPEEMLLQVFRLQYLDAVHAAELISDLLVDADMNVAVEEKSNTLIIRAPHGVMSGVTESLQALDPASRGATARGGQGRRRARPAFPDGPRLLARRR